MTVSGAMAIEQNDNRFLRRYLSDESTRLILNASTEPFTSFSTDEDPEDNAALAA